MIGVFGGTPEVVIWGKKLILQVGQAVIQASRGTPEVVIWGKKLILQVGKPSWVREVLVAGIASSACHSEVRGVPWNSKDTDFFFLIVIELNFSHNLDLVITVRFRLFQQSLTEIAQPYNGGRSICPFGQG